ncbi:MAG: hypothetical protein ACT4RN_20275 [Pseudonocardia sp.]
MSVTTRAARVRRALTISAATVLVVVTAAACGTAAASPDPLGGDGYATEADGHAHSHSADGTEIVPLADDEAEAADADGADPAGDGAQATDPAAADPAADPAAAAADGNEKKDKKKEKKDGEGKKKDPAAPPKLDILGTNCKNSDLERHDGFQKAPRCVQTSFGEVAEQSPSLLIADAPRSIKAGEAFTLTVSTRNLKRDRFLKAADGGYYAESSFLDDDGIQRGHFHTACRMLESTDEAPDAAPVPAFFVATEDKKGGAGEDKVTVDVTGLTAKGTAQCAVWAGDGSHRVPMMVRANQTPAFDVVRITVE